jgi:hypothetical protein
MEGFMGEVVASEVLLKGAQVTGDYIFAILRCRAGIRFTLPAGGYGRRWQWT